VSERKSTLVHIFPAVLVVKGIKEARVGSKVSPNLIADEKRIMGSK